MPLNFPSNPSPGQTASVGGRTWTWNGNAWAVVTSLGQGNLESFSGNVIPSHNELYDLGHNERKWKHLYLGGNSLHIGNTSIRSDSNGVSLTSFSNSAATNNYYVFHSYSSNSVIEVPVASHIISTILLR